MEQTMSGENHLLAVVDAHVHFWDPECVRLPWLASPGEPYWGEKGKLPQCFTPPELLSRAGEITVLKSVHVEANPQDPIAETRWLQALADQTGHPHGIVAWVDLSSPDADAVLAAHAQSKNVRGIRQILNTHADPRYNYVTREYMHDALWRANLRRLASYQFSFDLQIYPSQSALAAELIDTHPDIVFILNHAGMCVDRNLAGWRAWRSGLRLLAARSNVVVKISGLAMFDAAWTVESLRPYVFEALDVFGASRCLFASNFPIDGLHSSYARLWQAYADIIADADPAERHALFIANAERVYRL